jgi:hypothetical protein
MDDAATIVNVIGLPVPFRSEPEEASIVTEPRSPPVTVFVATPPPAWLVPRPLTVPTPELDEYPKVT